MQEMISTRSTRQNTTVYFGLTNTDDYEETWSFVYYDGAESITATRRIQRDLGVIPQDYNIPLNVITKTYLKVLENGSEENVNLAIGLRMFMAAFPEIQPLSKDKHEKENQDAKWKIKIARYFGYNETTLALLQAPDGRHYIVRSAGYPYGRPGYDKSALNWQYHHPQKGHLHWNDFVHDNGGAENNTDKMARALNALPFTPCTYDDPMDEFEEMSEIERFLTREEIAEKYAPQTKVSLVRRFWNAALGKPQPLSGEEFTKIDVNRDYWYGSETIPNGHRTDYIAPQEALELTKKICADFGIPEPRKLKIARPKKPGFFERKKSKSAKRVEGLYYPETTDIALRFNEVKSGVSKQTLLHELAHHIDNTFVQDGEKPSTAHGMRFKRIHMHLMHVYDDVPAEELTDIFSMTYAYGLSFPLEEQHITRRDFNETRTVDILPAKKDDQKIPFRDFHPIVNEVCG